MSNFLNHLPVLVIIFPLAATLLCPLIGHFSRDLSKRAVIFGLFLSMVCAFIQLIQVIKNGEPIHYFIGGWMPPIGIEFVIDGLNGLIIVLVSTISWMTSLFSSPFELLERGNELRSVGYYSILCFLAVGLLGMSSTGDAFNLYVFMEITALSGYGLIAIGEEKGPIAAFRYLMTGTIGASMYLLGVGFLYALTGTLNMADLTVRLADSHDSPLIIASIACLIIGFGIKMALFPLHGWQPAAHSYAHPAADPMIAGIMIKIPAYAMLRFFFCIFDKSNPIIETFFTAISIMAICGILYGSLKALRYDTYNKILAFSSIGQVGYIAMGFAIGNFYGLVGAVLHIVSHAFMKVGLFYTSAALKYKYDIHNISELGQIYRKMPVTSLTMVVCALSMVGLPPFAGFFSKWYLALGAIEKGQYIFVAVLIVSSLLGVIYFFRIFENMFMGEFKAIGTDNPVKGKFEVPWQLIIPMCIVIVAIVTLGLFNSFIINKVLKLTVLEVFLG